MKNLGEDMGREKLQQKNYNIYFLIDGDKKIVNIVAIIYSRMNQDNQLKITMDQIISKKPQTAVKSISMAFVYIKS